MVADVGAKGDCVSPGVDYRGWRVSFFVDTKPMSTPPLSIQRIRKVLQLMRRGVTISDAIRKIQTSSTTWTRVIRESYAGDLPSWIYCEYAALVGHECDLCGDIMTVGMMQTIHEVHEGQPIVIRLCRDICHDKWHEMEAE